MAPTCYNCNRRPCYRVAAGCSLARQTLDAVAGRLPRSRRCRPVLPPVRRAHVGRRVSGAGRVAEGGRWRAGYGRDGGAVGGGRGGSHQVVDGGRQTEPDGRLLAVDVTQQPPQLVDRPRQQRDVVARQQQSGHLGELLHRRPVRVWHHLAERVHRHVQVVHALPLAAVDAQSEALPRLRTEVLAAQLASRDGRVLVLAVRLQAERCEAQRGTKLAHNVS